MAEPKEPKEPKVPDGPVGLSRVAAGLPSIEAGTNAAGPDEAEAAKAPRGGRRPYEEVLEENRIMAARIEELKAALDPFTRIPDDGAKAADAALYRLARGDLACSILCGDIRRAVRALR